MREKTERKPKRNRPGACREGKRSGSTVATGYLALAGMVIFSIVTVSPFMVPVISTS
jgi:hypothetical protein